MFHRNTSVTVNTLDEHITYKTVKLGMITNTLITMAFEDLLFD